MGITRLIGNVEIALKALYINVYGCFMDRWIYPPATIDFYKILSFICVVLQIEGSFFMVKIVELLDDLQLNQKIEGKKLHYIQLCSNRLNRWKDFMKDEFYIEDVEGVMAIHIKSFIQLCQNTGKEINSTINGSIATLRVFFQHVVDEEYIRRA